MLGEHPILVGVGLVQQQEDHVETREQRCRKVDVLVRLQCLIVAAVDRVRCSQDRSPGVERGRDAGFGDRDRLLLHDFVNVCAVSLIHLVELIDAADAVVREDEGSAFQHDFTCVLVPDDGSRQADT